MVSNITLAKVLIPLLLVGVPAGAYATGIVQKPGFAVEDRGDWGEVNDTAVEIRSSAVVHNPNGFEINLSRLELGYGVEMNGIELASGDKQGIQIDANGNTTVNLTTVLDVKKLPEWWTSHLEKGEESELEIPVSLGYRVFSVPFSVGGTGYTDTIQTDIIGKLDSSLQEAEGDYTGPSTAGSPELEIRDTSAKWGDVSSDTSEIKMTFAIHNPNSYPVPTPQFEGDFRMNEVAVAEWTANDVEVLNAPEDGKIDAGETRDITFVVDLDNQKMDDWFVSHVRRNEETQAEVEVRLAFTITETTFSIPPEGMKCSFMFRTGILVDNQKSKSRFYGCTRGEFEQSVPDPGENLTDSLDDTNTSSDGDDGGIGGLLG